MICPLCETKRCGLQAAALLVLGLAFALVLVKTEAIVGAVEKWESRVLGEISKGVWEPVETCFWFSPAPMLPPFPPRCLPVAMISLSPVRVTGGQGASLELPAAVLAGLSLVSEEARTIFRLGSPTLQRPLGASPALVKRII